MVNDRLYGRRYVITGIVVGIIAIYIIRLFTLQVSSEKYKELADSNAFLKRTVYPARGLIYDRNGQLLVFNQPAYDIIFIQKEIPESGIDTTAFCAALKISREQFDQTMDAIKSKKNRGYSDYTPQVFMTQLKMEDIAPLQEAMYKFPGFDIQQHTLRDYTFPNAAQVLGSIGEVSQEDIDKDPYYQRGDYSGRDGIEYTYEHSLRGEKGVEYLLRDALGRIKGSYEDGIHDIAPKAGTDLTLTLDMKLQLLAERLLSNKVGSIVAIEPHTGEILTMASSPTWNPALMIGRQRSKNYASLLQDPTKPLMNRATQATYPPGSTFKTVQACVALNEGAITPNTQFPCSGKGSQPISCTHSHGSLPNLANALEQSCNPYFWQAYRATLEKNGYGKDNQNFRKQYNRWRDVIMSFGYGQKFTDGDIFRQVSGNIPSENFYDKWYPANGWRAMTIRSNSIGQGEVQATPLQLANAAATIANGGYYITPHLNKNDSMLTRRHETLVDKRYFQYVQDGMWRVCEFGTGRHHKVPDVSMCGKTGTADNSHGRPHSIFIGYAPKEDPQIAVAVVIENSGFGATWAAPMASLIMEQYLFGEVKRTDLEKRMAEAVLNAKVQTRK